MDAEVPDSKAPPDPHDWNSLENYAHIHEKRMAEHPFVLEERLNWVRFALDDGSEVLRISGKIRCHRGVVIEVEKYLDVQVRSGRERVRGTSYRYNASFEGRHSIIRYDNSHELDQYDRHLYDLQTGEQVEITVLTRQEFPTLGQILDEVATLVGFTGAPPP